MNETDLVRKIRIAVQKKYKTDVWMFKSNDRFQRGIPDLIICLYGRFVALEVKDPERKRESQSEPMQRYNISLIKKAYGYAAFVENLDDAMEFLNKIEKT